MGRIITFYSYKGGTGRSMVLANVAWILASNGKRVLVTDWDLEAPGLHRYFAPFLRDPDSSHSEGIIDFVVDYALEAMTPEAPDEEVSEGWYERQTNLLRYAVSLSHSFEGGGTLDFVPAGRQGPTYAGRVNSFNWQNFYDRLAGGAFLEAVKNRLREKYDYVLIDSRTGVSDAAGICTVQLPDELVVCFTLNNQSISGAGAVASSVRRQRGDLRIWPVPMRIEEAETPKLELRMSYASQQFGEFLEPMSPGRRRQYWLDVRVPYKAFYAYEEILATIRDAPGDPLSLLAATERFTAYLTANEVTRLQPLEEGKRKALLAQYEADPRGTRSYDLFLAHALADREWAEMLATRLEREERSGRRLRIFFAPWDEQDGRSAADRYVSEVRRSGAIGFVISGDSVGTVWSELQRMLADTSFSSDRAQTLIPLYLRPASFPDKLQASLFVDFRKPEEFGDGVRRVVALLDDERSGGPQPPSTRPTTQVDAPPRRVRLNLPSPNRNFVDREEALSALRASFMDQRGYEAQVVCGLGGVGKTQLAIAYAYRYLEAYEVVWWIRAEDQASLAADYAALADALQLPERHETQQPALIAAVRAWLSTADNWLLVFDNATRFEDVAAYLPTHGSGDILITSRNPVWRRTGTVFTLDTFPLDVATDFLLARTGQSDRAAARAVAEELGGLPLALEQASAYVEATSRSLADYHGLLQSRQVQLLSSGEAADPSYPTSVASTIEMAFAEVRRAAPAAMAVLALAAFLAPGSIPVAVIRDAARLVPDLDPGANLRDDLQLDEAIAALRRYSLVVVRADELSVHRLVQVFARETLTNEDRRVHASAALESVRRAFPCQ